MSSKFIDFYSQLIQSSEANMTDSCNGLFTTDEEFKKMENAVNNLLITKKQIDSLSNERNSLMQLYESKISEQNEQIKYLKEENIYLKQLLNKQQNNESTESIWREKYELCLDNIMRQLLNNLKIQETIRSEFLKLEENDTSVISTRAENSYICTSNSWTFNNVNTKKTHRLHELLMHQQAQQLNLLNELSEFSKNLKTNSHLNHSHSNSLINHEMNKQSKLELKVNSTQSSQTNLLNSSTNSNNSQSRPSRIPKYNRDHNNQKSHHSSSNSTNETSKKKHYSSSTKIPQRKPNTPPQTLNKNPKSPSTNNDESQKVINSKTFDKTPQSLITECKEVKLFMNNKNLVDILLVPKEVKNIRTKDDEGYSTMSSEIMHRTQNTSNRTSTTNPETISTNSVDTSSLNNNNNFTKNCKKRYCFPTLKTFNYYSNNRYYHQYHKNKSSLNSCCKYLSDTDIQSLCNQLNSYDKDLFYNVFHLDTLYNNVDYILFNSYASDTELEYNYNRRYGRYNEVLDSNYQLYINDYFNQGYDDDDDDEVEEDEEEEEEEEEMDEEKSQVSQQQENELMDYELKEEYQFEIDYSNPNMVELSVDETDGFLFDDEDVNFVLDSKICLNEYKNMFEESKLNEDLIFSSQSISSSLRTSTSSDESSSEYPSSSDGLSIDSINPKNNYVLNHDYFIDSIDNYDEYELCDGNRLLIEETDENLMIDNFDLDDFVNQLNKQCKADKMLKSSENNSKKLQELTIKEATRIARNSSNSPEFSETSKHPVSTSLVRRHTITTMPISAACLVEKTSINEINRKIKTPGCQTPCDSPSKYIDTKAYVGSFTTPTNSRTSTPLRRAETVYKKHTYIPPDEESTKPFQNGKSLTSVGSTPVKVKNNFNTDFYRLCSDTFYDNSENNFNNNYNESTNSIFFKLKQHLEPEHLDDLQSNATNHVSNLFDKWLINSKG